MSIKLLILAFKKAEKETGSGRKTHNSQHLSDLLQEDYKYSINERTLRDYYTNYNTGNIKLQDDLKPKLIGCLCNYLGYKDYADFVNQNKDERNTDSEEEKRKLTEIKRREDQEKERLEEKKRKLIEIKRKKDQAKERRRRIFIISLSAILLTLFIIKYAMPTDNKSEACMTWSDSLYVIVSCDTGPFSKYGTKVEPLIETKLKNFKKITVNAATNFFSEATDQPLVWYYKTGEGEIEYFTAPGLHPTTGKTLDEITPYIIQKYVPLHSNNADSFVEE